MVKKGITHQRDDHLSRLVAGEAPIGMFDDLPNAHLFNVEMILEWSRTLVLFFTIGNLRVDDSMDRNLSMVEQSREYSIKYKLERDGILRLCVENKDIS